MNNITGTITYTLTTDHAYYENEDKIYTYSDTYYNASDHFNNMDHARDYIKNDILGVVAYDGPVNIISFTIKEGIE